MLPTVDFFPQFVFYLSGTIGKAIIHFRNRNINFYLLGENQNKFHQMF